MLDHIPVRQERPPIVLAQRQVEFTCSVCHRKGWGPPNSRVHPGKCRRAHTSAIAAKTAGKRKEARAKARESVHDDQAQVREDQRPSADC